MAGSPRPNGMGNRGTRIHGTGIHGMESREAGNWSEPRQRPFPHPQSSDLWRASPSLSAVPRLPAGPLKKLDKALQAIRTGHLCLLCPDGTLLEYGERGSRLKAQVAIRNPAFFPRVLAGGSSALGDSYLDGWWEVESDHLCDFLGILLRNRLYDRVSENLLRSCRLPLVRLRDALRSLTRDRNRVEEHYAPGNEFFSLILGPTMAYSCGYMLHQGDSLQQMQQQKYDLLCRKLGLETGGRLLDIGCGWGGFLLHAAARHHRVRGVGITVSPCHYEYAKERILSERMEDRIEVKLQDYRVARGFYDFITCAGMFEHVGAASYGEFMRQLSMLLKPQGVGLLHTVAVTDDAAVNPDPWIQRHIFPGARPPRLQEIAFHMQRNGLVIAQVDNLKQHYAETLRRWKQNFDRNKLRIQSLDPQFDLRFMRKWNYYLQSCEAGFRHSTLQLYQLLFCKEDHWPLPLDSGSYL